MRVKEWIEKNPKCSFHMTTPGGYVFLTPEQTQALLKGKDVRANPGTPEDGVPMSAEELLTQEIVESDWNGSICYVLTDYPEERIPMYERQEVEGMDAYNQEIRLWKRIRESYLAYRKGLEEKSAPELIEMATEIAATKFVYEELMEEGYYCAYIDFMSQLENPLEVLRDGWLEAQNGDHHEDLCMILWEMKQQAQEEAKALSQAEAEPPAPGQGVVLC